MLERQLITSKGNVLEIKSDFPRLEHHFADSTNYADVVLNQINQDRFYDPFFEGKQDLTILDLGANIGLFSLYAHDSAKVVYAVEPTPGHFIKLKEMTKNYDNIYPINVALNDKDEEVEFYISDSNTTMNSLANRYGTRIIIPGMTLQSILNEHKIDVVDIVKCDIEGSEMIAITDETLSPVKDKIKFWFLEVHATNFDIDKNRQILGSVFRNQGYSVEFTRQDVLLAHKP